MPILVRAHTLGFWDNTRRRVGDEFLVPDDFVDKAKWWHRADGAPPALPGEDRGPTPPGNANAVHVPGSPAAVKAKRPASSAGRKGKGDVAEGEEGDQEQDGGEPQTAPAAGEPALEGKPKAAGKGKAKPGSGEKRVI